MLPAPPQGGLDDFFRKQRQDQINEAVREQLKQLIGGGQYEPETMMQKQSYDTGNVNLDIGRSNLRDSDFSYGQRVKDAAGLDKFAQAAIASDYPGLTPAVLQLLDSGAPSLMRQGAAQLGQQDNTQFNSEIVPATQLSAQNFQSGERKDSQRFAMNETDWSQRFQSRENEAQRQFAGEQGQLARQNNLDIAQLPNPLVQQQALQSILQFLQPQRNDKGQPIRPPMLQAGQVPALLEQTTSPNLGAYIMQQVIQNALQQQQQGSALADQFFNQ